MNIPSVASVTTPSLQTVSATSLNAVNVISSGTSTNPSLLDAIQSNSIVVDVSTLGELLASTTRLQSKKATTSVTSNTAVQADTTQTNVDIAQLTLIAELFVDSFNRLQASNSSLTENPLLPTNNDSLLQAMNATSANAAGATLFEQLAQIGINLQNTALPGNDTLLTLDLTTFQSAVTQNPSATISLLTQSLQLLGNAETNLIIQNQEFSSGNISTTASTQKTTATSATSTAGNTSPLPLTTTSEVVPAGTDLLVSQALTTEALLSAITSTNNSQVEISNTSLASNSTSPATVINQLTAANGISAATETTSAAPSVTNNAVTVDQSNAPNTIGNNIITPATASSNKVETRELPGTTLSTNTQAQSVLLNTQALATVALNNTSKLQANLASQKETPVELPLVSSLLVNSPSANGEVTVPVKLNNIVTSEQIAPEDQVATSQAISFPEVLQAKVDLTNPVSGVDNTPVNSSLSPVSVPAAPSTSTPSASTSTATTSIQPSAVPVDNTATNTATATGINGVPTAINPLIAAAVAAFRMGDGIEHTAIKKRMIPDSDTVTAPEVVTAVQPVKLDLHEHPGNQPHDTAANRAYHQAQDLGQPEKAGDTASSINLDV